MIIVVIIIIIIYYYLLFDSDYIANQTQLDLGWASLGLAIFFIANPRLSLPEIKLMSGWLYTRLIN